MGESGPCLQRDEIPASIRDFGGELGGFMADPLTAMGVVGGLLGGLGGLFKKNPKPQVQVPQFVPTQTQLPQIAPPPKLESGQISPERYATIAELMRGSQPVAPAPRNDAILKLLMGG